MLCAVWRILLQTALFRRWKNKFILETILIVPHLFPHWRNNTIVFYVGKNGISFTLPFLNFHNMLTEYPWTSCDICCIASSVRRLSTCALSPFTLLSLIKLLNLCRACEVGVEDLCDEKQQVYCQFWMSFLLSFYKLTSLYRWSVLHCVCNWGPFVS